MTISKEYFTMTKEDIVKNKFGGEQFRLAKNGVYLLAHSDTVHTNLPTEEEITTFRGHYKAPINGLGGDDRVGCYIINRLKDQFPDCGYLISIDEETGDTKFLKDCPDLTDTNPKVFIAFDRKGFNEYVHYNHKSKKIDDFLSARDFSGSIGSRTSAKELAEKYEKPCVNMCIAAENFHMKSEFVDVNYLEQLFPDYIALIEFCIAEELDYEKPVVYTNTYKYNNYKHYEYDDYDYYHSKGLSSVTSGHNYRKGCTSNPTPVNKATIYCDCCLEVTEDAYCRWDQYSYKFLNFCSERCRNYYFGENNEVLHYNEQIGLCTIDNKECVDCANNCQNMFTQEDWHNFKKTKEFPKMANCNECQNCLDTDYMFKVKWSKYAINHMYLCSFCYNKHKNRYHMVEEAETGKKTQCANCREFKNQEQIMKAVWVANDDNEIENICNTCYEYAPEEYELVENEAEFRSNWRRCGGCSDFFLKSELTAVEDWEGGYLCNKCMRNFNCTAKNTPIFEVVGEGVP
jgi:hypothetical protein